MIPYYHFPQQDDTRNMHSIPLKPSTQDRLKSFNASHPDVDLTPYIINQVDEAVNMTLDQCEQSEKS